MPARAFRPCVHIGCGRLVNGRNARCDEHQKAHQNAVAKSRDPELHSMYGGAWRKARAAFLRAHPLCECVECMAIGRVRPATVVDHVIPHRGDYGLFWDSNNWQAMSKPCHDRKTATEDGGFGNDSAAYPTDLKPSRVPLTIVCGAPGSGKSTYVREHAGPLDTVIDLDEIIARLSGMPLYTPADSSLMRKAFAERNRLLRDMGRAPENAPPSWLIVSTPTKRGREWWRDQLGGELVVMTTTLDECLARIDADPRRAAVRDAHRQAALRWFARD